MKPRNLLAALGLLTLSACATYPDISQSRSPCRMEPGGWCGFVGDAAGEAWPYAVASLQAYVGDDDVYSDAGPVLRPIPRSEIPEEYRDKGFGYELFERIGEGGEVTTRILAFRGTDFDGFSDIFYGTLRGDQIDIAVRTFEMERDRFDDGVPWVVTGHSLGGALATEVSIRYPEVRAYMFNTSPFYGGDAMTNDVQRTVFNERGELLRRFARFDAAPAAEVFTINCWPGSSTFTKHRIRLLADCVTWIAAYRDADAHRMVIEQRIAKPTVECGPDDKQHPGPGFRQLEPCMHSGRRTDEG